MGYVYRYKPVWFRKYNYLLGVGMDCGTQLCQTIIMFGINLPDATMPYWWGNNVSAVPSLIKRQCANPFRPTLSTDVSLLRTCLRMFSTRCDKSREDQECFGLVLMIQEEVMMNV